MQSKIHKASNSVLFYVFMKQSRWISISFNLSRQRSIGFASHSNFRFHLASTKHFRFTTIQTRQSFNVIDNLQTINFKPTFRLPLDSSTSFNYQTIIIIILNLLTNVFRARTSSSSHPFSFPSLSFFPSLPSFLSCYLCFRVPYTNQQSCTSNHYTSHFPYHVPFSQSSQVPMPRSIQSKRCCLLSYHAQARIHSFFSVQ